MEFPPLSYQGSRQLHVFQVRVGKMDCYRMQNVVPVSYANFANFETNVIICILLCD